MTEAFLLGEAAWPIYIFIKYFIFYQIVCTSECHILFLVWALHNSNGYFQSQEEKKKKSASPDLTTS